MSSFLEANPAQRAKGAHTWRVGDSRSSRLLFLVPTLILIVLGAMFAVLLGRDPTTLPSTLIGKSVPNFSLPPVLGRPLGLTSSDLRKQPALVNVFASWCTACRVEHPLFMDLNRKGIVQIHGLNYKDRPQDAAEWLNQLGDPYTRTGADQSGRVSIDWGVYGVPETFVVSSDGIILYKHIGPVTPEALHQIILPLLNSQPNTATGSQSGKRR
jgi:cytochrome c biogenesis protein CcmG/thiol:disulfide interchange protein DsbE